MSEEMKRTIIWVTAPAAAGKTTAINELTKYLKPRRILTDAGEILALNERDINHVHHIHPNNDEGFLLTSSHHFDQAVRQLSQKLLSNEVPSEITLVELARGVGENPNINVSYRRLLALIPPEVFARSIFVYIKSSNSRRQQRNLQRKKVNYAQNIESESFFVPPKAMQDFFIEDDFETHKSKWPCPVYMVENDDVTLVEFKGRLQSMIKSWMNKDD